MKAELNDMINALSAALKQQQTLGGLWRGELSPSAVSTAVSIFALHAIDSQEHAATIKRGAEWLLATMNSDGTWGDSVESPSNLTATLLSYAALTATGSPTPQTTAYLNTTFGGSTDDAVVNGVLSYYGKDLTFSAPILVMCALAGIITNWNKLPQLPFEAAIVPQRFYQFLQLPVVSYAIPALIAVGILRHKKGKKSLLYPLRERFINPSLNVLERLQPSNGGFLEAAPLSAFVAMCLCGAGYKDLPVVHKIAHFLTTTVRPDGSWPIDTDLACWVTALSVKALSSDIDNKPALSDALRKQAFAHKHPFTGANPGGWGWSDLPGAAPDADDTAGNLIALYLVREGQYCQEVGNGIQWLIDLQNNDGGIPTFCKGWGKLPFDRSSPDISAHTLMAFELWHDTLPLPLKQRYTKSKRRVLEWLKKTQSPDGSWCPLWFGDQDAADEKAPVYGTAVAVEHLALSKDALAQSISAKGLAYLLSVQNEDGGWGGAAGLPSKVTFTARCLSALSVSPLVNPEVLEKGVNYLHQRFVNGSLFNPEPIGLYFARLWYSEKLYPLTFTLSALKQVRKALKLSWIS